MNFEQLIKNAPQIILDKLADCKTLRENPQWHPEDNTYEHIRIVTERALGTNDPNLYLTGLLHDICKHDTHYINPKTGFPTSPGHELAAIRLMERNSDIQDFISKIGGNFATVHYLVKEHMRVKQIGVMRKSKVDAIVNHPLYPYLACFTKFDSMFTPDEVITELQKKFRK